MKLPENTFYDHCDYEYDGSVKIEIENELHVPMFPNVDEHDNEN